MAAARLPVALAFSVLGLRRSRLAVGGAWSLLDQALISGTNLITMVILARHLSPAAFGSFALAYAGLLFAGSLQAALITQPHNVLGANLHGREYVAYSTSTAVGQTLLAAPLALMALVAAAAVALAGGSTASLLVALGAALLAWQAQEFTRRVLYTEGRVPAALANDVVSYGGQAAVIAALWQLDRLTNVTALAAVAATSSLAAILGLWQIRRSLGRQIDLSILLTNWRYGRWLGAAQLGYWLSSQLYLFLGAAMLGTSAAGALKAGQTIMGPLTVLLAPVDAFLPIHLSRVLASGGQSALRTQVKMAHKLVLPLTGAYCLLVAIFARPLLEAVYGESYASYHLLVTLLTGYYFGSALTRIIYAVLRATHATRPIFESNALAAVATLTIGWLAIVVAGVNGIALGMLLSIAIQNAHAWRAYLRGRN